MDEWLWAHRALRSRRLVAGDCTALLFARPQPRPPTEFATHHLIYTYHPIYIEERSPTVTQAIQALLSVPPSRRTRPTKGSVAVSSTMLARSGPTWLSGPATTHPAAHDPLVSTVLIVARGCQQLVVAQSHLLSESLQPDGDQCAQSRRVGAGHFTGRRVGLVPRAAVYQRSGHAQRARPGWSAARSCVRLPLPLPCRKKY
jgi:hypothetical protein